MEPDNVQAVPQPVIEPPGHVIALPTPRSPVLDPAAQDIAPAAPRPEREPAAHDRVRPVHESRAGWILSIVFAAAAAWAVGWVAGVSWAWREMTPGYLSRTHRRRGAGRPGAASLSRA